LFFPVVPNDKREYKEIIFEPADKFFKPKYSQSATKRSAVDVKESNYFNAIQSIAETFKVWPKINIEHTPDGTILNKSIKFQNYIGQPNYVGFKYGINSKGIKRTLDSKQIVSKLIVKANTNEYAPNGFCTIARANANYTKDNVIYDFGYYANKGLLDATTL
jgi:phage minor structural protein